MATTAILNPSTSESPSAPPEQREQVEDENGNSGVDVLLEKTWAQTIVYTTNLRFYYINLQTYFNVFSTLNEIVEKDGVSSNQPQLPQRRLNRRNGLSSHEALLLV